MSKPLRSIQILKQRGDDYQHECFIDAESLSDALNRFVSAHPDLYCASYYAGNTVLVEDHSGDATTFVARDVA